MKIVGVIGPYYSGGDKRLIDINIANARTVMRVIGEHFNESKLVGFFCPHSHTSKFERESKISEEYAKMLDTVIYDKACDGFVVLPNWEKSKGSQRDVELARVWKKECFYLVDYNILSMMMLLGELEKWSKDGS
jgi:hypothetical protein